MTRDTPPAADLTQRALSELLAVGVPAIAKHLKNILDSSDLDPSSTASEMETVRQEGQREVTHTIGLYNLDAVISEGYSVNRYEARTR